MEPARPARVERRLAAILAADVAGYSRLIEANEESTLSRLKALRAEVIDPKIAAHTGRLVKTTGDGLLVEFASVVDALRCAAEIQAALAERNAPLPADKRIDLRIGLNMGDIVVEDGDIFGDGGRTPQAASTSVSKTWAIRHSRTSRVPSGSTGWSSPLARRCRRPALPSPSQTSRRSRSSLFRT